MPAEEPTIEDVMLQLNELKTQIETLTTENVSMKEEVEKSNEALAKARKLNSELLNRVPVKEFKEEPVVEDSFETLMKETIEKFKLKGVN